MDKVAKNEQLQIRLSAVEKSAIKHCARLAGMDMSSWVLCKLFPSGQKYFHEILAKFGVSQDRKRVFAELHDFLNKLDKDEFKITLQSPPVTDLGNYLNNYVAAMIEYAAYQKRAPVPAWVKAILPLQKPVFGSDLKSLRLYLLNHSPPAFRRRNIFIDSSIGQRI
ncbi:MAG: hypothetical protein O7D86_06420 [Proteobacteria bacterium]|nr:hypothetical protein [Pseudomonadota bacterium]